MPEQITIDQYTTLSLNEYKGTYSLVEGWINRDGEFKANWCKREFGKKGEKEEKVVPVSIKCGGKEGLEKLAHWILETIKEEDLPF